MSLLPNAPKRKGPTLEQWIGLGGFLFIMILVSFMFPLLGIMVIVCLGTLALIMRGG